MIRDRNIVAPVSTNIQMLFATVKPFHFQKATNVTTYVHAERILMSATFIVKPRI